MPILRHFSRQIDCERVALLIFRLNYCYAPDGVLTRGAYEFEIPILKNTAIAYSLHDLAPIKLPPTIITGTVPITITVLQEQSLQSFRQYSFKIIRVTYNHSNGGNLTTQGNSKNWTGDLKLHDLCFHRFRFHKLVLACFFYPPTE